MKKHSPFKIIIAVLIPLAVGFLSSLLAGSQKFGSFAVPQFTPPGQIFPIIWTILYVLIGIASYIVYNKSEFCWNAALKTYAYQLFVNFTWPIVFFRFRYFTAAAIVLIVLILLVIGNIIEFCKVSKTAGIMMIPYLIWCLYALSINIGVAVMN